jgi:hypothetical protein
MGRNREATVSSILRTVKTPATAESAEGDCRCSCGRLLARLTRDGLEVKCRRCRRVLLIAWADISDADGSLRTTEWQEVQSR